MIEENSSRHDGSRTRLHSMSRIKKLSCKENRVLKFEIPVQYVLICLVLMRAGILASTELVKPHAGTKS